MRFVQIPTTLLAQVDSSVGGKTAINSPLGKNLVGAFHQPSLVLADTGVLDTLSAREFRAGYAEVVKYGLIGDRDFFAWLERDWREVFAGGPARLEAIATSCAAKARVVAADETEQGERALLNLGHTFGHALERLAHYDGETPRPWRGRGDRHGLRVPLFARPRPVRGAGRVRGSRAISRASACRPASRQCPASNADARRSSTRCARTRRSSAAA